MKQFEITDHGTVLDRSTGLEWQAEPAGPMSWDKAMNYAEGLDLGGHTDWRMPNRLKLESLLDLERLNPASAFPGMPGEFFWSSSVYANGTGHAWYVYFGNGYVDYDDKYSPNHVRCVRRGSLEFKGTRGEIRCADSKRQTTTQSSITRLVWSGRQSLLVP